MRERAGDGKISRPNENFAIDLCVDSSLFNDEIKRFAASASTGTQKKMRKAMEDEVVAPKIYSIYIFRTVH